MLDLLNERQRAAVTAGTGPVLVLAGPGSGKTRVLTHRIAYLIQEMDVSPYAIVAVTFTNKAAGEMRARVEDLLGRTTRGLKIGTFHAICARFLRQEWQHTPYGADYVIYDTDDQDAVIKLALAELNLDPKKFNPRQMRNIISGAKNELITPSAFSGTDYFGEVAARVYQRYQAILLDNNAVDFDDLIMQMALLLQENPIVAEKYQQMLEFVLVDEFQDTNTAQYRLVESLAQPQNNVFVVGDEDQGIYAFRGADYRNVLHFRKDYPDAEVILLEQNYRSTQTVLDVARSIIDRNVNRTPKALFTDRGGGVKVIIQEAYNEEAEAHFVIETIESLRDEDDAVWNDFAVMYRTNAQSRALEDAFIRNGIPYRLVGGVGFYKRREIRDLLAYLRLVSSTNDTISLDRVINTPRRGIGRKSLAEFQRWAKEQCESTEDAFQKLLEGEADGLSGRVSRLFSQFAEQLHRWREIAATGDLVKLIDAIMADIGYNLYLNEISDTPEQAAERAENIQELRGLLGRARDEAISLVEFLAEQSLVADVDQLADEAESVTLLTLHAAKGLEFPVVFITGLEEGLLPHIRAFDEPEGIEEERRLMYVGVTRAKDRLYITHSFRRTTWGRSETQAPSRFLVDIPLDLTEGMSPKLQAEGEINRMREQTRWRSTAFGQTQDENQPTSGRFRDKIIPFPGKRAEPETTFKRKQRVKHQVFGPGTVVDVKVDGAEERVVVVFDDKKTGIKTLTAEYLSEE